MKKFIFWVIVTILYETIIVGFGSYMIGKKLGDSIPSIPIK